LSLQVVVGDSAGLTSFIGRMNQGEGFWKWNKEGEKGV
jgi:hypothetical protein